MLAVHLDSNTHDGPSNDRKVSCYYRNTYKCQFGLQRKRQLPLTRGKKMAAFNIGTR